MSKSNDVVKESLVNHTNAVAAESTVKDCHYHYLLEFNNAVGWFWLQGQVEKCSNKQGVDLEMWKVRPDGVVDVREVARRASAREDEQQRSFNEF